jgi:hypothetical protein
MQHTVAGASTVTEPFGAPPLGGQAPVPVGMPARTPQRIMLFDTGTCTHWFGAVTVTRGLEQVVSATS